MSATIQLNTRIDPDLKRQGDAVFARAGLSSSEVVRALWSYAAHTQTVPDILVSEQTDNRASRIRAIREGSGLVRKQAKAMGIRLAFSSLDVEALQDDMYDDLEDKIHGELATS